MSEKLEKFVKNLQKLDKYWVLGQQGEYLIIGTKINILEHRHTRTTFISHTVNKEKELPVFFLVTISKNSTEFEKKFSNKNVPILYDSSFKEYTNTAKISELFDNFIKLKFLN